MLRTSLSNLETLIFLAYIHAVFEEISEKDPTLHLLTLKVTYVCGFSMMETEIKSKKKCL
jgi:hypothetical protein